MKLQPTLRAMLIIFPLLAGPGAGQVAALKEVLANQMARINVSNTGRGIEKEKLIAFSQAQALPRGRSG